MQANLRLKLLALAAIAVLVTAVHCGSVAQAAPAAQGNCPVNTTGVKVTTGSQGTSSSSFANLAESFVNFTQGGTRPACILVSFSGEALAAAGGTMIVRAVLDGRTPCEPSTNFFLAATNQGLIQPSSYAMQYVCTGVTPGAHTLRMQFSSNDNSSSLTMYSRTVAVHYFK